jgi:metal-sulfur cluster biosynthetic enzyme
MSDSLDNANPTVFAAGRHERVAHALDYEDSEPDAFDPLEVFELIRRISDPEHPLSLEQLNVVRLGDTAVDPAGRWARVEFTPTVAHCSMSTLIGLSIKVKVRLLFFCGGGGEGFFGGLLVEDVMAMVFVVLG